MGKFSGNLLNIAAKSDRSDKSKWLPFVFHSLDTAGIIRKLFQKWIPEHVRDELNGECSEADKLCTLIALLHDIGKLTPAFQSKIFKSIEGYSDILNKLGIDVSKISEASKSPHNIAGNAILEKYEFPREISEIVGFHHGRIKVPDIDVEFGTYSQNYFGRKRSQEKFWKSLWEEWINYSLNSTGFTIETLPELSVGSQMILIGLLIMADWIASNPKYFPYVSFDEAFDGAVFNDRVERAWEVLGLPKILNIDACDSPEIFNERFSFAPNFVQSKVMESVLNNPFPGLYILEAPMGLGKTEAALTASEILIEKFGAGGIYFGLPTQATANGIFGRIKNWAEKIDSETHSIRLAHGMTELNKEYRSMFRGRSSIAEDTEDNKIIVHEWFEGRKQALLSDFVIATIDQFLLASLKQRHVMLRHLGLAGKVVILDECHAYDSYMNVYLDQTLRWMGAYKVPVIILSATLPSSRREEMLRAYMNLNKKNELKIIGDFNKTAYPALTYTFDKNVIQEDLSSLESSVKEIKIEEIDEIRLSSYISDKIKEGGCCGVIVNTVSYAQKLSETIEKELNDFEIVCFHSRFIATDRAEIESRLLNRVGKNSTSEDRNKLIVVGTQVMEQSLDLDFDLMITELCPMDLLLQRSGRLHRHERTRPLKCENAVLAVLKPTEEQKNSIYSKWILDQTEKYLPDSFAIPSCIPELIDKVYSEPDEESKQSNTYKDYQYEISQKKLKAEKYCIRSNKLGSRRDNLLSDFVNDDAGNSTDAEASVRDSDDSIEVIVLKKVSDGEYCTVSGDISFKTTLDISEEEAILIARERIRLNRVFALRWNEVAKKLDNMPKRWRDSKFLKGELLLLLNEELEAELINYKLRYNAKRGLEMLS